MINKEDRIPVEDTTYCYCNGKEIGELFPYYNKECIRKLFHSHCVKLKNKPKKKKWLCSECRKKN